MGCLRTRYTAITGVAAQRMAVADWRHVDLYGGSARPVGPSYSSFAELRRGHVDYLLRGGWLRLARPLPEAELRTSVRCGSYAWRVEDQLLGIMVYGDSRCEAYARFRLAVAEEFGGRVTVLPSQY